MYEIEKRSVALTNRQWSDLTTFLLLSKRYRERERDTWEKLAKETKPNGKPKFKNAKSNAQFWQEEIDAIERMMPDLYGITE